MIDVMRSWGPQLVPRHSSRFVPPVLGLARMRRTYRSDSTTLEHLGLYGCGLFDVTAASCRRPVELDHDSMLPVDGFVTKSFSVVEMGCVADVCVLVKMTR